MICGLCYFLVHISRRMLYYGLALYTMLLIHIYEGEYNVRKDTAIHQKEICGWIEVLPLQDTDIKTFHSVLMRQMNGVCA